MKRISEIDNTLGALRSIWKDGRSLLQKVMDSEDSSIYSTIYGETVGYISSVQLVLQNVFFNKGFYDEYVALIKTQAYDSGGDCLIINSALSMTITYITNLGKLIKGGYIKDPYAGICNDDSKLCFVAMWFDDFMDDTYCNGIKPAVESLGYDAVRIDKQEHNGRIDQKIFELIRKSRFLIADFSGNRAGVYYEAGFAAGQGLPVIHICREADFSGRHFDVSTYNTIKYNSYVDLKPKLIKRIKSTIGCFTRSDNKNVIREISDSPF